MWTIFYDRIYFSMAFNMKNWQPKNMTLFVELEIWPFLCHTPLRGQISCGRAIIVLGFIRAGDNF